MISRISRNSTSGFFFFFGQFTFRGHVLNRAGPNVSVVSSADRTLSALLEQMKEDNEIH